MRTLVVRGNIYPWIRAGVNDMTHSSVKKTFEGVQCRNLTHKVVIINAWG
jgi:hypothetical protein